MSDNWVRLVDTVIDFLYWQVIYSSILFICILPVCLAIKRTSPYWLYYIWFLVPLRLIVPPDYALSFSIRSAIDRISEIFHQSAAEPLSGSGYSAAGNYVNTHLIYSVPHAEWTASILVLLWFTGLLIKQFISDNLSNSGKPKSSRYGNPEPSFNLRKV